MSKHSSIKNVYDQNPGISVTTEEAFRDFKSGKFKDQVEKYRRTKKVDKAKADDLKKGLPGIVTGGVCEGGISDKCLVGYAGEAWIDIDNLFKQGITNPESLKSKISQLAFTKACAISASGDGLVAVFSHNCPKERHAEAAEQICDLIEFRIEIEADRKITKVLSARRFATYDPHAYYNPGASIFQVIDHSVYDRLLEIKEFTDNISEYDEGNRNNYIYQFSNNCQTENIDHEDCEVFCKQWFRQGDFLSKEIKRTVASAYSTKQERIPLKAHQKGTKLKELKELNPFNFKDSPRFGQAVYQKLPNPIQQLLKITESEIEKDLVSISSLVVISSIIPKVTGVYMGKRYKPNLFWMGIAPPASSKSMVDKVAKTGEIVHEQLKLMCTCDWDEFNEGLRACGKDQECIDKLVDPLCAGLFVPGNISAAALIQELERGNDLNLLIETETDTVSEALKKDYGGFSDMLRKLFEHERISVSRKEIQNERNCKYRN